MEKGGLPVGVAEWFNSPAGDTFLEWFKHELELSDTLTPQEKWNKYERSSGQPPVPIDTSAVMVREGRAQAYKKMIAIRDAMRSAAIGEMEGLADAIIR